MCQRQAEAQAKPKPKPLAKPKPQPQAQHPPPPMPPPHPLAAKISAKAVKPGAVVEKDEEDELESLRGDLQSPPTSLEAHRRAKARAKARAEAKVVAWEAKVDALRAQGEEEGEDWAAALFEKVRQKVRDREDNIPELERRVKRMDEIVAKEAKVKDEVVDEGGGGGEGGGGVGGEGGGG